MNIKYRVEISKDKKFVFSIDIGAINSEMGLSLIRERFSRNDGFEGKLYVAKGERRLLESSDNGINILASEIEFEFVSDLYSTASEN